MLTQYEFEQHFTNYVEEYIKQGFNVHFRRNVLCGTDMSTVFHRQLMHYDEYIALTIESHYTSASDRTIKICRYIKTLKHGKAKYCYDNNGIEERDFSNNTCEVLEEYVRIGNVYYSADDPILKEIEDKRFNRNYAKYGMDEYNKSYKMTDVQTKAALAMLQKSRGYSSIKPNNVVGVAVRTQINRAHKVIIKEYSIAFYKPRDCCKYWRFIRRVTAYMK